MGARMDRDRRMDTRETQGRHSGVWVELEYSCTYVNAWVEEGKGGGWWVEESKGRRHRGGRPRITGTTALEAGLAGGGRATKKNTREKHILRACAATLLCLPRVSSHGHGCSCAPCLSWLARSARSGPGCRGCIPCRPGAPQLRGTLRPACGRASLCWRWGPLAASPTAPRVASPSPQPARCPRPRPGPGKQHLRLTLTHAHTYSHTHA